MRHLNRLPAARRLAALVILAFLGLGAAPALAQTDIPPPKPYEAVDGNNVNVSDGSMIVPIGTVVVGPAGQGGLSDVVTYDTGPGYWRHSVFGVVARNPAGGAITSQTWFTVSVLGESAIFQRNIAGVYLLLEGDGALVTTPTGFTYTAKDGTVAEFSSAIRFLQPYSANMAAVTSVTRPDGERLDYNYNTTHGQRLQSVTNNLGYQLHFQYASDSIGADWTRIVSVTALNTGVDACDPLANVCTYSRTWPSLSFTESSVNRTATDALGRTTRLLVSSGRLTGIARPTMPTGQNDTITWGGIYATEVSTFSNGEGTWSYVFAPPPPGEDVYTVTNTVTDPLSHVTGIAVNTWLPTGTTGQTRSRVVGVTNALGQTTQYGSDYYGRPSLVIMPEGDRFDFGYGPTGVPGSWTHTPKPGSGLSPVSITATFGDCSTVIRCAHPTSITDQRGGVTDFTYDAAGNLLTETGPAPTPGAPRPQTRHVWEQRYAWYKQNGSSTITQAATPVWVQTSQSQCMTGATC